MVIEFDDRRTQVIAVLIFVENAGSKSGVVCF